MTRNQRLGIVAAAALTVGGVSVLRATQGLSSPFALFQQIREMQKANRELEVQIAEKQARLDRLDQGASEAELEVKRRLKYLKRGEVQLVVPQQQQQQQQPATAR